MPRFAVYLYPLAANVLWGSSIVAMKYVVASGFSPPAITGIRFGCAALVFSTVAIARRGTLRAGTRRTMWVLAAAGAVYAANQIAFVFALRHAPATVAALVMGIAPLVVVLLAAMVGLERISSRVVVAGIVSFLGVALVVLGSRGTELAVGLLGVGLCLLMPFTWGGYSLIVTRPSRDLAPDQMGAVVTLVAFLLVMPVAVPPAIAQGVDFGWQVWACIVFSVLGGVLLATLLWFKALELVGPGRSMLFMNVQPISAVLLAWALLGEPITVVELLGGATIVGGIMLAGTGSGRTTGSRELVPAPE